MSLKNVTAEAASCDLCNRKAEPRFGEQAAQEVAASQGYLTVVVEDHNYHTPQSKDAHLCPTCRVAVEKALAAVRSGPYR